MAINKERQVKEIIKCGKDPLYFINQYAKIVHTSRGTIPFRTYPFQDECIKQFLDHRFNVVLKGRQLGMSTLTASFAVWLAVFHKDKKILIIANKLDIAVNFMKKVKGILKALPKWMVLPDVVSNNRQSVEFSHGSSIKAIPTSDDAGRSEALSLLIVDEAAFVRNFDELWTGLYPTLSTGGRAILISTPNGVGGMYHQIYTDGEAGINEFNAIRLPWDVHPEYDQAWFEQQAKNLGSRRRVAQELLCDFVTSGDTFLSTSEVEYLRSMVRPPIDRIGADRNVWVWKHVLSSHQYIVSADIARGDGKDFSAFHVIDVTDDEVVAEYKGKIPPDRFGELLVEIGTMYNEALLCPENNSFGYATLVKIRDLHYPRIYHPKSRGLHLFGYSPVGDEQKAGFNTNGKNRMQILAKLEEVLRNKQIGIYSSRFYEEIKAFIYHGGRAQAMKGKNDDLVMSLAIGVWLFDTSGDASKYGQELNNAMLASMSTQTHTFDTVKNSGNEVTHDLSPFSSPKDYSRATIATDEDLLKKFKWLI